jgi:hypothetical protein
MPWADSPSRSSASDVQRRPSSTRVQDAGTSEQQTPVVNGQVTLS